MFILICFSKLYLNSHLQCKGREKNKKTKGWEGWQPFPNPQTLRSQPWKPPSPPHPRWAGPGWAGLRGALKHPLRSGLAGLCSRTVFGAFSNTFKPGFHMPSAGSARCWSLVALTGGTDPRSSSGVPAAAPRRLQQRRLG